MGDLDLILEQLQGAHHDGRPLALLFDYDGTLVPIRPTPEEATLPASVRDGLLRLITIPNVSVGVISGRALADVRKMVDVSGMYLAGTSGIEVELRGQISMPSGHESLEVPLRRIVRSLTDVSLRFPGAWIERKPLGLTMHYRAVSRESVADLRVKADETLREWKDRFTVEEVAMALEILPMLGRNKGTAVREILADIGNDPFCVFAGDSVNDAAAIAVVQELGGVGIGVGTDIGSFDAWLPGPSVVGLLIVLLANAVGRPRRLAPSRV